MAEADITSFLDSAEAQDARKGKPGPAERLAALAARHPDHAMLMCYHADALHSAGDKAAAAQAYRRALSQDDTVFDAWYGLGAVALAGGAYGAAVQAIGRALTLRPEANAARCNLGEALFNLGFVEAAVREYRQAAADSDAEVRAHAQAALALILVGDPTADNAAILQARRSWIGLFGPPGPRKAPRPAAPGAKRRIGYLSAHFGARNWMKPVWAVINRHDRATNEIHLISDGADPTAESGYRDHAEDRVWRVRGMPNETLARHIAAAGLDVLVDLNGYSVQHRLPLFLLRPAPRSIGWFNMFATTGMAEFDAIVGDDAVLPADEEPLHSEPVVRVPGSYLAFEVGYPVPDIAPPPCLQAGSITFGCLGSGYKLTEATISAWARILNAAPGTQLFLRNRIFDDPSNVETTIRRFADRGVGAARLALAGGAEHYDFLESYRLIDIALDTFPYNGGTTTMEALWQGVPVLTFDGDRWAGRTSKSLLLAAGLADWVAPDLERYVTQAIAHALDPQTPARLAALRARMRAMLAASAVCDAERLCRALERVYAGPDSAAPDVRQSHSAGNSAR